MTKFTMFMNYVAITLCCLLVPLGSTHAMQLHEKDYFTSRGLDVWVFNNWYDGLFSDSKISGIELVHHGVRTATNGDVRLNATPEQWDAIPTFVEKNVDREKGLITASMTYPDHKFDYSVEVVPAQSGVKISVVLPKPLPQALVGKAGFNLEFLPSAYFEKAWLMDGQSGLFPLYPTGQKEQNEQVAPVPLAKGSELVLAPTDRERRVRIRSEGVPLSLYDGRNKAQNGWFVVRSMLPANKSGTVLTWHLDASTIRKWTRKPVIGHSQVGYHPDQQKVAVIELDGNDRAKRKAKLIKVNADGTESTALTGRLTKWGQYTRYLYWQFDFSKVADEGIYYILYDKQRTAPFPIAKDVYSDVWHPTLDVYLPVQMDHVLVNEAYRVWHGASHLDDALQAPVNHVHFDLYASGPTTDTQYEPGEHIPGLNIGGWYDAGDYDIRTQTQYATVNMLVNVWENFQLTRDTTLVDYKRKYVDIHVPDGKADLLQQIEHGTLGLIAQFRAVGHAIPGIIVPDISQYTHLGDGLTMTDNLIYNPKLGELESNGFESGKFDDRWAFTTETTALNYGSTAALAAASRALKGYNDELANESLQTAVKTWDKEQARAPLTFRHGNTTGRDLASEELGATLELLIATGDSKYKDRFLTLWPVLEKNFSFLAPLAVRALPFMDDVYRKKLHDLAQQHTQWLDSLHKQNPYGVQITEGGWAGNGRILLDAVTNYYLHTAFPDTVSREHVLKSLTYLFGTHPYSNLSFVSAVGAQSKKVAYGMNRADFSFIPGGVVPGVLILKPDFPENKEDWPFFWGQNEYVVNMGAYYLFVANAAQAVLEGDQ